MSIQKQFHLQLSQSPRSINKTSLKYDLALLGQSERLIKQPQIAPQKRQRSMMKQQLFLKTQIQNSSLNKTNEDFLFKKQSQNQIAIQEQLVIKDLLIQEYEKKYRDQISICQQLTCQVEQQRELIDQLQLQINHLKLYNLDLKKQIDNSNLHQQCNQKQLEYKEQLKRFDEILRQTMDQNYAAQQKIKDFELKTQKLKQQSNDLKYHIICKNCNAQIKNAVTLIPCAHTFCNRCINNFKGQCFVCLDQNKVTATYSNDYITDLAQIYQTLESLISVQVNRVCQQQFNDDYQLYIYLEGLVLVKVYYIFWYSKYTINSLYIEYKLHQIKDQVTLNNIQCNNYTDLIQLFSDIIHILFHLIMICSIIRLVFQQRVNVWIKNQLYYLLYLHIFPCLRKIRFLSYMWQIIQNQLNY